MFRWGSVEVFAFRDQDGRGPVFLQARLTFRYLKGSEGKTGPRHKTIPLRLLPPENVAEDSLFWLMTLGLIDGVFHGISSWSDIERLQPARHGQLIPIVESMRGTPVSRGLFWTPSNPNTPTDSGSYSYMLLWTGELTKGPPPLFH